jgi:hypothetical protein
MRFPLCPVIGGIMKLNQHISFFQHKTLTFTADKMSLRLYSSGSHGLHILTLKPINDRLLEFLSRRFSKILYKYAKRQINSKLFTDKNLILEDINKIN